MEGEGFFLSLQAPSTRLGNPSHIHSFFPFKVSIVPPYTLSSCAAANPEDTKTMDRVKKVLEAERARMSV